jgi:hypothetical protein
MATTLQGFVYDNAGNAISGATVQGYVSADEASVTAGDPTTTDTNGKWTITTSDPTHIPMDIKITYGSNVRWLKGYDKTSLTDISVGNIALDSISADDTDINIAVSDNSATALTVKQGTDSYLIVDTADGSESVSIGTGIAGTSVTLGNATSEVTVAGNLTVSGTQTVVNTVTMNATNAVVFEGATADDFETTLTIEDPTADRTVVIPDVSGTIPILAADSDTAITATPAELNLLDGDTAVGGSITIADSDGFVVNDGGVMKTIPASDINDYVGDTDTTYTAGALLDLTGTQFDVDLTEAAEAAIADGDYILFLDGGATGTQSKEAVHDLATLFAGTGLTATNSVLAVDSSQTQITAVGTLDTGAISSGFGNIDIGSSTFDTTGAVSTGNLSIATSEASPNVTIGGSSATTAVIELIAEGTSGTSFIDFHAENAPADYGLRVQRFTGANGSARIDNKGTGDIEFYTDATEALRIDSSQNLGIGAASSGARLEVVDSGLGSSTVFKVTQDDQNPYGVIVGNDTFSTSDIEGLALYVTDAGESKVRALGTGAELHLGVVAGSTSLIIDSSQNATFAGDLAVADAKYIKLGGSRMATAEPATNSTGYGVVIGFDSAGSVSAGDAVYINSSGKVARANAQVGSVTDPVIGIATNAGASDGDDVYVLTHGIWRMDAETFTAGDPVYVGESAGALTPTAPSTDGDYVQRIGIAVSDDCVLVMPSIDVIEHA